MLRRACEWAIGVLIWPALTLHKIGPRGKHPLAGLSQWCAILPGTLGRATRAAMLRRGAEFAGEDITVEFGTLFSHKGVSIGDRTYIGAFCIIGWAHIEEDVLVGSGVHILSGRHTHRFTQPGLPVSRQGGERNRVRIGKGCWIGNGAIVMADVGEGSVVGAGAVVSKPIPHRVVAVGSPARVIRHLDEAQDSNPDESPIHA